MLVQQRDLSVGFDRDQARSLFLSSFDSNLKCVETNADAASTKTSGELFKLLIENINVLSQVQPLSVPGSSPLEQTNIEQAVNALNASTSSAPMTPPPSSNHISDSDKSDTALSNNITPTVNTEKEAERSNKKRKSMDKSEKPSIHLGSLSSPSDTRALLLSPHNSAVKIQSAFRGHIERQAMEKERTLRDLPITSPSTPSSTCKRKNKRRRFSNTPGSARHRRNMTISEGMDENNSNTAESFSPSDEVEARQLHFRSSSCSDQLGLAPLEDIKEIEEGDTHAHVDDQDITTMNDNDNTDISTTSSNHNSHDDDTEMTAGVDTAENAPHNKKNDDSDDNDDDGDDEEDNENGDDDDDDDDNDSGNSDSMTDMSDDVEREQLDTQTNADIAEEVEEEEVEEEEVEEEDHNDDDINVKDDDVENSNDDDDNGEEEEEEYTNMVDAKSLDRVKSELSQSAKVIHDTKANWALRVKAMNNIEDLVLNHGALELEGWRKRMNGLKKGIAAQLGDLRSSIVREACRLLIGLADGMGDDFDDYLVYLLPHLFQTLFVTIKVISESGDQCIRALLERTHTFKVLPVLRKAAGDSHSIVKRRVSEYALIFVKTVTSSFSPTTDDGEDADESNDLDREEALEELDSITDIINKNISDSDKDVRKATRALYSGMNTAFPLYGGRLYEGFASATQKAIKYDAQPSKATSRRGSRKRGKGNSKLRSFIQKQKRNRTDSGF